MIIYLRLPENLEENPQFQRITNTPFSDIFGTKEIGKAKEIVLHAVER